MSDAPTTPVASRPEPVRLTPTPTVVAAIDVGASAMRLIVAQHLPGQRPQVLEEASRGVLLGRDTFTAGRIGAIIAGKRVGTRFTAASVRRK